MQQQPIRIIRHDSSAISIETEDWVTADEIIAFLELEEPRLAAVMRKMREIVLQAAMPGFSDEQFWQARS